MASQVSMSAGRAQGGAGFELPGFTQIAALAFIGNLIGLYAWTSIAIIALAFCAALFILETNQATRPQTEPFSSEGSPLLTAGFLFFLASVLWTLVGGVAVGGFQLLSFKLAASVALALFAMRTGFYVVGRYLTALGAIIALLLCLGLGYSVYACYPPADSPEVKEKEHRGCKIVVTITDEHHAPIPYATVDCQWRDEHQKAPAPGSHGSALKPGNFSIRAHEDGIAETFLFLFNPEKKVAYLDIAADGFSSTREELRDVEAGETREVSVTLTKGYGSGSAPSTAFHLPPNAETREE